MKVSRVMYQSHLRRDLEKRIKKSHKMYILPFAIIATLALIVAICALAKSNKAIAPVMPTPVCNQSMAIPELDNCNNEADERVKTLPPRHNITLHCCIKKSWDICVSDALTSSDCQRELAINDRISSFSNLFYHANYLDCRDACPPEVDETKVVSSTESTVETDLTTSHHTTMKPVLRKAKKWNGPDWDDNLLSDNDTLDSDDSLEVDVNDIVFHKVLNVSDVEEDDYMEDTTTMAPTTSTTGSSDANKTETSSTNGLLSSSDEITLLMKKEEENSEEDDLLSNETSIDTSDLTKTKTDVRQSRGMINSGELIKVNLIIAGINFMLVGNNLYYVLFC